MPLGLWGNLVYPFRFGTCHIKYGSLCKKPNDPGSNPGSLMFESYLVVVAWSRFQTCSKIYASGFGIKQIFLTCSKELIKIAKEKSFGSVKRFGPRYGRTVKHKLSKIEAELKKKHKCPYCHSPSVKRVAVGIWSCKKCNSKFTGKAYSVSKKIIVKEKPEEEEFNIEEEISRKEKGERYSEKPKKEEDK
jgi:large subunit ribosomal protein L37Ae